MALTIKQRDNLGLSTVRLTSLISDHEADFGQAYATTSGPTAQVRADATSARVSVARAQTLPASAMATRQSRQVMGGLRRPQ
jgi:hypothetical protein